MSRDIKYIGMDVHKEAVVIVVLNSSGKLVMESIVETKASSILQFIHGLRGELHVTWEGTWAGWLYDLLQQGEVGTTHTAEAGSIIPHQTQEASIAVLSGSGKLVMESIVETKAKAAF